MRIESESAKCQPSLLSPFTDKEYFVNCFRVTAEYARGLGLAERSFYNLSVQFLNRVSYVTGK